MGDTHQTNRIRFLCDRNNTILEERSYPLFRRAAFSAKTTGGYAFTLLFAFDGTNGLNPEGGVIEGSGRVFYGTTIYGGADGGGVVFSLSQ